MSQPNFEFDYDKFLRESSQVYNEALWEAIRERYGTQADPNYRQHIPFDDKARLPYDIEGEVFDINYIEWQPLYRWFNDRKRNEWYYQYKPFDEWFTLLTITGEYLYAIRTRRNPSSITNASRIIKDQLAEKRFYKVERLY